jgi:signal transduction histidine kinase
MDQKGNLAKELLDATDTILLCVAHQSSLVDEILQFSKLDAAMLTLAPSVAQPKYDLAETLKLFQPELRAKNIGFEYAMDVSFDDLKVGYVLADLKRIKQVLVCEISLQPRKSH